MEKPFHIRDLLDTLHFLSVDEERAEISGHAEVDESNRRLVESQACDDDRARLAGWLSARRETAKETKRPGDLFVTASALLSAGLVGIGAITGYGGVFSFLAYSGAAPVNVLVFFVLFILIQALLATGSALPLLMKIKAPESLSPFGVMTGHLFSRAMEKAMKRLPAERRTETQGLWRRLQADSRAFGRTLFYLIFSRVQLFAVAFAVGALSAFATRILFFDTAFGWQTTIGEGAAPQVVHGLAQWVALPWSWCFPDGVGVPNLDAVAGSRVLLKEGIKNLSGAHLTSWWPFLAMGLVMYGLLPRLCLLLVSQRGLKRAANRELLAAPQVRVLLEALCAHSLTTKVTESHRAEEAEAELTRRKTATPSDTTQAPAPEAPGPGVLVPEELEGMIPDLEQHLSGLLASPEIIPVSMEEPARLPDHHGRLYLVQEAWQAPIRETLDWIEELSRSCTAPLTILLIGEVAEDALAPPEESHVHIWRKVIAALALPGLRVDVIEPGSKGNGPEPTA